jgi:single-stranded-DNA-specific exonuclease
MPLRWIAPELLSLPETYTAGIGGHPLVAQILARRGFHTLQAARAFLDWRGYDPASPFDLPDMDRAVDRLLAAIQTEEAICVWGDFDVDGQTSTTLLVSVLRQLGAQVTFHIPVREHESHGVNLPFLEQVINQGARLVLTCDTGVTAHEAVVYAKSRGVELIITDHHDLPPVLPEALAVVNPHRLTAGHPLGTLPGVGVAYQLAAGLFEAVGSPGQAEDNLDLAALGIVADLALLRGDTRYLLQRGLPVLRETERLGLQALFEFTELNPAGLTEEHIGFGIGPRLNALGRLADANLAVEFLTTPDKGRARVIAMQLEGLNAERQLLTEQVFQAALAQLEREPDLLEQAALVLSHPAWPAGVIGIVASRLVERFQRPTVLISAPPGEMARGSARSVVGCDISAAIAAQKDMLLNFGGHPMAAGLAIPPERIPEFRRALSKTVENMLAEAQLEPSLQIDGELPLDELSWELVADLERLAPFGAGNPPLTLAARGLRLKSHTLFGRREEHRQLIVEDEEEAPYKVIWWGGGAWPYPDWMESQVAFDLAYTARASNYRGQQEVQIEWIAARPAEGQAIEVSATQPVEIQDYRHETHPLPVLQRLRTEGEMQVWAEGEARQKLAQAGIAAHDRNALVPGQELAIWTIPPGRAELQKVLADVSPQTVYLFAVDPQVGELEPFLKYLAGLVKFVLKANHGRVRLTAMAAASAQTESAVQAGLAWFESHGDILILSRSGEEWLLRSGQGQEGPDAAGRLNRVKELLIETAAFRTYYRRANVEGLTSLTSQDKV